jgi:hypothetical protein
MARFWGDVSSVKSVASHPAMVSLAGKGVVHIDSKTHSFLGRGKRYQLHSMSPIGWRVFRNFIWYVFRYAVHLVLRQSW